MALFSKRRQGDGLDLALNEELRAWAYQHCVEIHQNRIITKRIISEAAHQFSLTAKRNDRKDSIALEKRAHRNRVTPERFSEFQRCVFDCSKKYEMDEEEEHREGRLELTPEQMIARLIEQVVFIGFYNSFWMTVGVSQILHKYDAEETLRIYDCLVQYTRPEKQLWDIRRQKSNTMDDLDKRFGYLLIKDDRSKRERKYKRLENQAAYENIVEHWLDRLKPLAPSQAPQRCIFDEVRRVPIAASETPNQVIIPELLFVGSDPNDEQSFEMLRMHVLLHPPCFSRLTTKLGLEAPRERRNIPAFNLCRLEMAETCS
ncbi:MAG TPA: hypothetical protein VGN86_12450 [Pyrinomonadaceae bacterium]|nr:hypothetical protein [Pyrinomonadaceae bacterium]